MSDLMCVQWLLLAMYVLISCVIWVVACDVVLIYLCSDVWSVVVACVCCADLLWITHKSTCCTALWYQQAATKQTTRTSEAARLNNR